MQLDRRSDIIPIDPSDAPSWVSEIIIVQYFQFAIVSLMLYDTVTTMNKEIKYFWSSPQKLVSIVYFANRYVGVLGAISNLFWNTYTEDMSLCLFARWTHNIANWLSIILVDYILVIRVLALFSKARAVTIALYSLLVLEAASKLAIFIYIALHQQVLVFSLPTGGIVCGVDGTWPLSWSILDWAIPMAFGALLMVLAFYKAAEFWTVSAGFKGFNLVKVLILDQTFYFSIVIFCCVLNIIHIRVEVTNEALSNLLELLGSPAILCVLGSHMLFHLKEAGEAGVNAGTSFRMKTMSELEFA